MDTSTSFLGCRLPHPFIAGASPLGFDLDAIKRLEDGGCAAMVIPSLFEEQITLAGTGRIHQRDPLGAEWAAALAHFPGPDDYALTPDGYAEHIARVKRTVAVPVIASLNGTSGTAWLTFSRIIEQAGADALELNLYEVITDLSVPGTAVEHELTSTVGELKRFLKIPIAVKISPFFAAFGHVARQLDAAGTDGIVLFNRFYFTVMREGLERWMEQHEFRRLTEMRGLASLKQTVDPAAFERAHYIRTLQSWRA